MTRGRHSAPRRRGRTADLDWAADGTARWRPCPACGKVGWTDENLARQVLGRLRQAAAHQKNTTGVDRLAVERVYQCNPDTGLWHTTSEPDREYTPMVLPPPPQPIRPNTPEYWIEVKAALVRTIRTGGPQRLPRLHSIAAHFGTHLANAAVTDLITSLVTDGWIEQRDDIPNCGRVYVTRFARSLV